jgi:hypothetical protein
VRLVPIAGDPTAHEPGGRDITVDVYSERALNRRWAVATS